MKFKQLLSKTLLVAAGLCLGASNAWAAEGDEIYSNDFSTKDQTDFATWLAIAKQPAGYSYVQIGRLGTFSIASGALVNTPEASKSNKNVYNGNYGTFKEEIISKTKSTNYVLSFDITLTFLEHLAYNSIFEISGEDDKTILCLYASHSRSNSTTGSTSYGYIVGGDNAFRTKEATYSGKTNTEGAMGNGTKHEIENVSELTGSKTYHVILDAQTVGLAKLTIKEGANTVVDENVSISADNGLKYMYLANCNSNGAQVSSITLDNFSIVEGAPTVAATANYTVKYVADISGVETEISTAVSRTGLVGNSVTLLDSDKNAIRYNDKKYVYSSDNASSVSIANDNSTIVKIIFTEAPSYAYSVTDNIGNSLASGTIYQGEDLTFYVPYYVFDGGKFYKNPALSSGTLSYGACTIKNVSAITNITVTYTEEASTNVVFYSEAENLTGATIQNDGYTNIRMSNGKAGYYTTQTAFANLPAGKYTLTAASRAGTTKFYAGAIGEGVEIGSVVSTGSVVTTTSDPFILTSATDIYSSVGSESVYFDYVIIRRTGDAVVPVTIPASGYATISSAFALDCANLGENVKAYKVASIDKVNKKAVLEEVNTAVEAGTGLIIAAAEGNINIPVAASGSAVENNLLKAAVTATDVVADQAYGLSDGKFKKLNPGSVPAGKAYLLASDITSAPELDLDFGGTTAITNTNCAKDTNIREVYNLNGQRVAQPTRGLYIVNGKKVVIK